MDHARKIGRDSKPKTWTRPTRPRDRVVIKKPCSAIKNEEEIEEDHRLANWKRWLADRERRQRRLAEKLRRDPLDLALNAHELVRGKYETKTLLEAASRWEETHHDKYRGNPIFWRVDGDRLHEDDEEDDVMAKLSRQRQFLPTEITRIALPNYIKKEKMLVESHLEGSKINLNTKWDCGDYLRERTEQLKDDLDLLEPKKPEMTELIVVGRNFHCGDPTNILRTPVITITQEEKRKFLNDPEDRLVLKVQNREFVLEKGQHFERLSREETERLKAESNSDLSNDRRYAYSVFETERVYKILGKKAKPVNWTLQFESTGSEISQEKIYLENRGVQIIRIDWRNITPTYLPISVPDHFDSCFFFNKNDFALLPGQKIEIPIWFRSERPIVASETWKMLLEPRVYPGNLTFRFFGVSSGEDWKASEQEKRETVKEELRRLCRNSLIRDLVDECFRTATCEPYFEDVPYDMFFLESDVFHARNPGYFYRSLLIDEMKAMYKMATDDESIWCLSLEELRSVLLKMEEPDSRRRTLNRFREICFELLRPQTAYTRPTCTNRRLAYWLFCSFVNRFEEESDLVISRCVLKPLPEARQGEETIFGGEGEDAVEYQMEPEDYLLYRQILHIRIYCLLEETVGRICAALDSQNYFNKPHDFS